MIVDASVWVAMFRENDVHHGASVAFLDSAVANQQDLNIQFGSCRDRGSVCTPNREG
jgi:predicted nucleic acid-binding protein